MEGTIVEPLKILEKRNGWTGSMTAKPMCCTSVLAAPRRPPAWTSDKASLCRYDEKRRQVVGVTIMGMRTRLTESLKRR